MSSDDSVQLMDLKVISPSPDIPQDLHFDSLPISTTVQQLKEKIRDAVPSHPPVERQRLIYQGRPRANPSETMVDIFGAQASQQNAQHTIHLVVRDWTTASNLSAPLQRTASVPPGTIRLPTPPVFNPFQAPTGLPRPSSQPSFQPPAVSDHVRQHIEAHQRAVQQASDLAAHAPPHPHPIDPLPQPLPQGLVPLPQGLVPLPQGLVPPPNIVPGPPPFDMMHAFNAAMHAHNQRMAMMQNNFAAAPQSVPVPEWQHVATVVERLIRSQAIALHREHGPEIPIPGIAPLPDATATTRDDFPNIAQMRAILLRRQQLAAQGSGHNDTEMRTISRLMPAVHDRIRNLTREALARRRQTPGHDGDGAASSRQANVNTQALSRSAADQSAFQQLVTQQQQGRALAGIQGVQRGSTERPHEPGASLATSDDSGLNTNGEGDRSVEINDGSSLPSLPTAGRNLATGGEDTTISRLETASTLDAQPVALPSTDLASQPLEDVVSQSLEDVIQQVVDQLYPPPSVSHPAPPVIPALPDLPSLASQPQQVPIPNGQRWTFTINSNAVTVPHGVPGLPQMPGHNPMYFPTPPNLQPPPAWHPQFAPASAPPLGLPSAPGAARAGVSTQAGPADVSGIMSRLEDARREAALLGRLIDEAHASITANSMAGATQRLQQERQNQHIEDHTENLARNMHQAQMDMNSVAGALDFHDTPGATLWEPDGGVRPVETGGSGATTEQQVQDLPGPASNVPSHDSELYVLSSPAGPYALLVGPSGNYTTPSLSRQLQDALLARPASNSLGEFEAELDGIIRGYMAVAASPDTTRPQPAGETTATLQPQDQAHAQHQPQPQPQPANQAQPAPRDLLAEARAFFARANLAAHFWLLLRLAIFIYFFSGNSGWRRPALLGIAGAVVYLAQVGALGDLPERLRRHFEGLLMLAPAQGQAGRQGQGQDARAAGDAGAANNAAVPGQQPPNPHGVAQRLVRERRERDGGWAREQFRTVERAVALFVASLWPGVGERVVAAREQQQQQQQQVVRSAQAAQEVAIAAERARDAGEEAARAVDALADAGGRDEARREEGDAAVSAAGEQHFGRGVVEGARQTAYEDEQAGRRVERKRGKGKERAAEAGEGSSAGAARADPEERVTAEWGPLPDGD